MPDELISMQEYCRRYNKSPNTVKAMIARGEIQATRNGEGSHWLIRVGGDTVSRKEYEKLMKENERLKAILVGTQKMLEGVI